MVREYNYGASGHLEQVDADGNLVDFLIDDAARTSRISRPVAGEQVDLLYDGRGYLRLAERLLGGGPDVGITEPTYSSEGVLMSVRRVPTPSSPEERVSLFYFGDRPVAQLEQISGGSTTWTYLSADHLGAPLLATDSSGSEVWQGPFEPFGRDSLAGTAGGALENGIFLRLVGQWEDETWIGPSLGAAVFYNVHRWYETGTGRYTRADPLGLENPAGIEVHPYLYVGESPLNATDPLGLYTAQGDARFKREVDDAFDRIRRGLENAKDDCCDKYFSDRGIQLGDWTEPGGPPYIRQASRRGSTRGGKVCGWAQKGPPFIYAFVNWDCFRTPDPCLLASVILHEMGHLARQDTQDNEPSDFFKTCRLPGGCVNPGRGR